MKKKRKVKITNSESNNIKKKRKRRIKKVFKILLNIFLVFLLLCLIGGIIFIIYIVKNAPKFKPENLYTTESSIVYDKDNNQIGKLGVEKRVNVKYNDLPEILLDAIIATEDSRYMQHNGFDLPRFLKASAGQVVNKITGHGNAGGGSTLDMQVVKNRYTSNEDSGIEGIIRKFTDIYISIFKLEKNYSKEEIMEFYVNIPFLGNNSYGVEQACQGYFGKSVSDINLSEAAIIAGLFQAPSAYDPYLYPENTAERRETVLYLMRRHGYITKEEEEIANSIPIKSLLRSSNPEASKNPYQPYINIVISEIENKTKDNPYKVGMKIYTNLDTSKQDLLQDIMNGNTWKWKDEKVQAGIAVVDVNNGALLAVGGGRNQTGELVLNYASGIRRQIGSCAKPLFDYGPAFEFENASLASQVYDAPHSYSSGVSVKNADGGYKGVITYKYALAASRNVPALKVFQSNNNSKVRDFVTSLGIEPEIDSNGTLHEAHALGAFTGSNPVELAGAYAAFANGGYYSEPYAVSKIEYMDTGKTVSLKTKRQRVMSDSTAYMITDALLYAVNSYGNIGGSVRGVSLAAKTGTTSFSSEARKAKKYPSSANMDMWVTGYTPDYAVSLWYGYEEAYEGYYLGNDGYTDRGKLFRQIISGITNGSSKSFTVPNSVVKATVEKETSPLLLASSNTPDDMKVTEYFKRGTVPTEVSPRYNKLPNASGLNVKDNDKNIVLSWTAAKIPDYLTDDGLRQSMKKLYGNKLEEQLQARKAADGQFGYEIFAKDTATGKVTSLGFTTNTSYTIKKQKKDMSYIVKTSYSNLKITQSDGITIEVKYNEKENDPSTSLITYKINGSDPDKATVNTVYTDPGIVVYYEAIDVTSKANITVTCKGPTTCSSTNKTYTFTKAGEYTLTYTIKYNNETEVVTRKITVTDADTGNTGNTDNTENNNNKEDDNNEENQDKTTP